MDVAPLAPRVQARLESIPFSYPEVGATLDPASGEPPQGYLCTARSAKVGVGAGHFETVSRALMCWQVHRQAGIRIAASSPDVRDRAVVLQKVGLGRLQITGPCRVVYVIDEPRRRGFAYGTLAGHPESGEESFVVEHQQDDSVTFTISAFSRHATALARAGGPVTRVVQRAIGRRFVRAAMRATNQ